MKPNDYIYTTDYSFKFNDIKDIVYPVYVKSVKTGEFYNFRRSVIYSNNSYSRNFQLSTRSIQEVKFDTIVDIDYFNVEIIKEFPLINTRSDIDNSRSYYLLDYFIPSKSLCIELDSDLHNPDRDRKKDEFLNSLGIEVLRVKDFQYDTLNKFTEIKSWFESKLDNKFSINYDELIDNYINKTRIELNELVNSEYDEVINNKNESRLKYMLNLAGVTPERADRLTVLSLGYDKNIALSVMLGNEYSFTVPLDVIHKLIPLNRKDAYGYNRITRWMKIYKLNMEVLGRKNTGHFIT